MGDVDLVIRTGFAPISYAANFDPQKIIKGKALSVKHVRRVEEIKGTGTARILKARVIRTTSVTESAYYVELHLKEERVAQNASCNCISGKSKKCKHIYALMHYVNTTRSLSKTAYAQEWGRKPSEAQLGKEAYAQPLIISDEYKAPQLTSNKKPVKIYNLTYEDIEFINCPLRTVLEIQNMNSAILFIQSIIDDMIEVAIICNDIEQTQLCAEALVNIATSSIIYDDNVNFVDEDCKKFYNEHIVITPEEIVNLCFETKDQSECENWFKIRNIRINTSSKAHSIKTRCKKTCEDLVKDFMNCEKKYIASLEYGIRHERDAINEYIIRYEAIVKLIGVYIMPVQPWLCVSPDGLIIQDDCIVKILEVKCPSSCKSKPVFDEESGKFNVPYLYLYKGDITLKESYKYYTQCQILMYATGLTECDLYIWSPKGSCLANVHRDEQFLCQIVPNLKYFYFNFYLPALCLKNKEKDKENQSFNYSI